MVARCIQPSVVAQDNSFNDLSVRDEKYNVTHSSSNGFSGMDHSTIHWSTAGILVYSSTLVYDSSSNIY